MLTKSHWQKELDEFLVDIEGVVDANSFEHLALWQENKDSDQPMSWEEYNRGFFETIGSFHRRPICVSMFKDKIDGKWILFIDPTSEIVDHRLIEEWLNKAMPTSARNSNGSVNRTNAMNFSNVFRKR